MMKRTANLVAVLAFAALVVAWVFLLRPASLGGPVSYVIVSGHSMEPTLHTNDLAVVRKQSAYGENDVIAFHVPEGEPGAGATIIHRIVGGASEDGFVVQGDNKESPDPWRPTNKDVLGKVWFHLPGGGGLLSWLREPLNAGLLAGLFAMLMVLSPAKQRTGGRQRRRRDPPLAGQARRD